jgi:Domain of unknown function (DUF4411)
LATPGQFRDRHRAGSHGRRHSTQLTTAWLPIAHAGDPVVVMHSVPSQSTKKIKIPDACIGLGVKCVSPYTMPAASTRDSCRVERRKVDA